MSGRNTTAELEINKEKQSVKRASRPGAYKTPGVLKVLGRKTIENMELNSNNLSAKMSTMSGKIYNNSGRKIEEDTMYVRSDQVLEEKKNKFKKPSNRIYIP